MINIESYPGLDINQALDLEVVVVWVNFSLDNGWLRANFLSLHAKQLIAKHGNG